MHNNSVVCCQTHAPIHYGAVCVVQPLLLLVVLVRLVLALLSSSLLQSLPALLPPALPASHLHTCVYTTHVVNYLWTFRTIDYSYHSRAVYFCSLAAARRSLEVEFRCGSRVQSQII